MVRRQSTVFIVRIPTNVTAHSGERDRLGNRGVAGGVSVDRSVTIGQIWRRARVGGISAAENK